MCVKFLTHETLKYYFFFLPSLKFTENCVIDIFKARRHAFMKQRQKAKGDTKLRRKGRMERKRARLRAAKIRELQLQN